ncbi:MAG: DUF3306 domain-containing protein [Casimicrobiaceae bacterium]
MPADATTPDGFSLKRWSRRKLEAARESAPSEAAPTIAKERASGENVPVTAVPIAPVPEVPAALPPIESLTIDSDFTAFMKPNVDESLKRLALKKLLTDPRFNVMDGLDIYIDDYTKSDPIPPDILERLVKGHFGFNPPSLPADAPHEPAATVAVDPATSLPASEPISVIDGATADPAVAPATPDAAPEPDPVTKR